MKRFYIPAAICSIILLASTLCFAQEARYQHKIATDEITFEWTADANLIHIRLSGKTTGWVGIGFNPTHAMKNANFVIGYVKDKEVKITNQFGNSNFSHAPYTTAGKKSGLTDVSGKEANGTTEIAFTMPLKSRHNPKSDIKPDAETTVMLAHGPNYVKSFFVKHQYKTELQVNLSTGKYKKIQFK